MDLSSLEGPPIFDARFTILPHSSNLPRLCAPSSLQECGRNISTGRNPLTSTNADDVHSNARTSRMDDETGDRRRRHRRLYPTSSVGAAAAAAAAASSSSSSSLASTASSSLVPAPLFSGRSPQSAANMTDSNDRCPAIALHEPSASLQPPPKSPDRKNLVWVESKKSWFETRRSQHSRNRS